MLAVLCCEMIRFYDINHMYEDVLRIENRSERDPRSFCESESDLESDFAETARITFTSVLCCVVLCS